MVACRDNKDDTLSIEYIIEASSSTSAKSSRSKVLSRFIGRVLATLLASLSHRRPSSLEVPCQLMSYSKACINDSQPCLFSHLMTTQLLGDQRVVLYFGSWMDVTTQLWKIR